MILPSTTQNSCCETYKAIAKAPGRAHNCAQNVPLRCLRKEWVSRPATGNCNGNEHQWPTIITHHYVSLIRNQLLRNPVSYVSSAVQVKWVLVWCAIKRESAQHLSVPGFGIGVKEDALVEVQSEKPEEGGPRDQPIPTWQPLLDIKI